MDSELARYMLTEHGILPSEVVKIPLREKLLMMALVNKQTQINKDYMKKK